MKIGLPGNSPKKENNNKTSHKNHNQNKKNNKKKFVPKKKKSNAPVSWREKDGFVTAIIDRKLIKIDMETFEIHLPNGFKINNNKTLEGAKKKAIEFFSGN